MSAPPTQDHRSSFSVSIGTSPFPVIRKRIVCQYKYDSFFLSFHAILNFVEKVSTLVDMYVIMYRTYAHWAEMTEYWQNESVSLKLYAQGAWVSA